MALIFLGVSAAAMGAWGLFWLVQAFVTGRARGVRMSADRVSQPARFWLIVAVLVLLVAVSSTYLAWAAVAAGVVGSAFRSRHSVVVDRNLPESPVARLSAAGCETPGPRVCFVAVGVAPDIPVDSLARYYSTLLGSPVGILEPIALTREAEGLPVIDERRSQVGIGALERLVRATYPMPWGDRDVTVVILTGHDLWLENRPGQRYAFGAATVRNAGGGFAIVSSARMDPAAYGQAADPAVLERRMHAMLGKYLAMLRYGAKPSADPISPVYNAVQSPADLDRMRAFSPPR
jgi:hypothetical protein